MRFDVCVCVCEWDAGDVDRDAREWFDVCRLVGWWVFGYGPVSGDDERGDRGDGDV